MFCYEVISIMQHVVSTSMINSYASRLQTISGFYAVADDENKAMQQNQDV